MVSSIFNILYSQCILFYDLNSFLYNTSLNSCGYKTKMKTTPYTALSIDDDAYYCDIQTAARF